mmetsp:Transcript_26578/g.84251  ORF Transcript_26578/g.84251 Transcript_26578/m.84251 type:complete len:211 (+) Transcript_26578:656-1288(+)|eukprot:scaffold805_cov110-Isochrysis_galbana.AAC.7
MRDFSSRYVSTDAPTSLSVGAADASKLILVYLPKRDELWLRTVLALPSDSSTGDDWTMRVLSASAASLAPSDRRRPFELICPAAKATRQVMYRIRILADSVLPAPDSPDTTTDWFCRAVGGSSSARYAASAIAYWCGGVPARLLAAWNPASLGMGSGLSGLTAISRCATYVYGSSRANRPARLASTPGSCRYHRDVMSGSSDGLTVKSSP